MTENIAEGPPSSTFQVLVIIANYNSSAATDACIDSIIRAQCSSIETSVLVIENSDDGTEYSHSTATVIVPPSNVGLGGAWALGYSYADQHGFHYCLFLNNDAVVDLSFFSELSLAIGRHGQRTAFGPRILRMDTDIVWSRGGKISVWRASVAHFGGQRHSELDTEEHSTGHLSGCCLLVPLSSLRTLGGPDPRYFFRGEEWDLSYRLLQSGTSLVICDSAVVCHRAGTSHDRFEPRMLYFAYRAKILFARTHQPALWFVLWLAGAFAYTAVIAPIKFQRLSGRRPVVVNILQTQSALLRALIHGVLRDRIEADDF